MTEVSYSLLHFNNDEKPKSFMGGMASIVVNMYMIYCTLNNAMRMVTKLKPSIMSTTNGINLTDLKHDDAEQVHIVDASKPLITVLDGINYY